MEDVTLAEAKAHLSELVERATRGEAIRITRRGRPVARITGLELEPKRIDLPALRALTDAMPLQQESARDWIRTLRDGSRF